MMSRANNFKIVLQNLLANAYCAYASSTAAQSKQVQNRSYYVSIAYTPYPANIHAYSCTLTQKSGYSVRPSASSATGVSYKPYIPELLDTAPTSEAGSVGSDTMVGQEADVHELVKSAPIRCRRAAGRR
jgi:hypothetical protein